MSAEAPLILVVEDDPETRRFYMEAFADAGFQVDQAHNGNQALHKTLESLPDLILTDIAVPGLDGIELCKRIRSDERTRAIPVLAITGYGDRRYPDRVIDAGANRVLIKPCDSQRLVEEARRLLSQTVAALRTSGK